MARSRGDAAPSRVDPKKNLGLENLTVAFYVHNLAEFLGNHGRLTEAEALHREALAIHRKLRDKGHPEVPHSLLGLADVLRKSGRARRAEAEALYREALAGYRKLFGNEHERVFTSLVELASLLRSERARRAEAEALYREALTGYRKLFGDQHEGVFVSLVELASLLRSESRLPEAETLLREAVLIEESLPAHANRPRTGHLTLLAYVLRGQGKWSEAEVLNRKCLALSRTFHTNAPARLEQPIADLAHVLHRQGKFAQAEPLARELLQLQLARTSPTNEAVLDGKANLARMLTDWSWAERTNQFEIQNPNSAIVARAREAERLLRQSLATREATLKPGSSRVADTRSRLGGALLTLAVIDRDLQPEDRLSVFRESEKVLLAGHEGLQRNTNALASHRREAIARLANLYDEWHRLSPDPGRAREAARWKQAFDTLNQAKGKDESDSENKEAP